MIRIVKAALEPGPGLACFAIAAAIIGGSINWRFFGIALSCCFVVAWIAMLTLWAVIPPPTPLSDRSALFRRLFWFLRALWASVVFALAAIYGALVARDIEFRDLETESNRFLTDVIGQPLLIVLVCAGMFTSMSCAYDLWAAGEEARIKGIDKLLSRPDSNAHESMWIGRFIGWVSTGATPVILGYLLLPMSMVIWASIFGPSQSALRIF